jgi:predicted metal-dependent enzyme (double-stranded beta helix superfamily)
MKVNVMSAMRFDMFLHALDRLITPASDPKETVLAVRRELANALRDEEFRPSCVERILDGLDPGKARWRLPAIHRDRTRGYAVCVFHWMPGLTNTPHRHDYWTVTGVLHNNLCFRTFQLAPDQKTLLPDKTIDASAGEVGYICTPCIHNVANPSRAPSLSLHIFNHPVIAQGDIELVEFALEGTQPQPGSRPDPTPSGTGREALLSVCAAMLAQAPSATIMPMLDRIFALGGARAKLATVKAMCAVDPSHAAEKARAMSDQIGGPLSDRLRRASEAVLRAPEPAGADAPSS